MVLKIITVFIAAQVFAVDDIERYYATTTYEPPTDGPPTTYAPCPPSCPLYASCVAGAGYDYNYCVCDAGFVKNPSTGECDDIDECSTMPCSGKKSVCVNTLGSYECKRPGQTSNYGIGYGDPHFSVQTPGEDPVCFDFHGYGGDIYTLLFEPSINLIVNAEFEGTARKSWMKQIGVKTQDGNEILITSDNIILSRHGRPLTSLKFDGNQK